MSFGSRYVISPAEGDVHDYLSETAMGRVRNRHEFAGILAFDKWTCNADGRQVAFWKRLRERKFTASFSIPALVTLSMRNWTRLRRMRSDWGRC